MGRQLAACETALRETRSALDRCTGRIAAQGDPAARAARLEELDAEIAAQCQRYAALELALGARGPVPAGVGRHAYRIVQEGLTTARKHAPGARVTVSVAGGAEEGLVVEIGNALPAASPRALPGAGAGLIGLAERVQLAGGRLDHGRTPDGRFELRAWLPWQP